MWKYILKEYFTFTKNERIGIISLVVLIAIAFSSIWLVDLLYKPNQVDFSKIKQKIEDLKIKDNTQSIKETTKSKSKSNSKSKTRTKKEKQSTKKSKKRTLQLFEFNPNTISKKDALKLGFNYKQINTLIKYRESGGKFKVKSDLKKIYAIDEEFYLKLKAYIALPDKTKHLQIEINTATKKELININGIGDYLAGNIIKYRKLLGGFYSPDQLEEVYGMHKNNFDKIITSITINKNKITKIDLVKDDFKTILKHPYFDYNTTKKIKQYVKIMGGIKDSKNLIKNNIISTEKYNKIKHYIKN